MLEVSETTDRLPKPQIASMISHHGGERSERPGIACGYWRTASSSERATFDSASSSVEPCVAQQRSSAAELARDAASASTAQRASRADEFAWISASVAKLTRDAAARTAEHAEAGERRAAAQWLVSELTERPHAHGGRLHVHRREDDARRHRARPS